MSGYPHAKDLSIDDLARRIRAYHLTMSGCDCDSCTLAWKVIRLLAHAERWKFVAKQYRNRLKEFEND